MISTEPSQTGTERLRLARDGMYRPEFESALGPVAATDRKALRRVDHRTMQTSLDGVFAAGDIVRGASLVVSAIRDGRAVAERMHACLKAMPEVARRERVAA